MKLSSQFSPKEHSLVKSRYIEEDALECDERIYNLPLILSVHFCGDVLQEVATSEMPPQKETNLKSFKMLYWNQ